MATHEINLLYHPQSVYITFILTVPLGFALGLGEYKCDIHLLGWYNIYNLHKYIYRAAAL